MAANNIDLVAADGSDTLNVQINNAPSGGSQTISLRGCAPDQGGYIAGIKVANTRVGEFSGNH